MELSKSILIIKANPNGMGGLETYLRNRGWVLFSTTDMKSGFSYLFKNKPSVVMVAVDHPNKKIRVLPKLLAQAYPVCILAFTESASTHSYKMLMECGVNYKINPPATGPAVERTVNRFIKEQQSRADLTSANEKGAVEKAALYKANMELIGGQKHPPNSSKNSEVFSFKNKKLAPDGFSSSAVSRAENRVLESNEVATESESTEAISFLLKQIESSDAEAESIIAKAVAFANGPAYRPDHSETKPVGTGYDPDQKQNQGVGSVHHEGDAKDRGYGNVRMQDTRPGDLLSGKQKNSIGELLQAQSGAANLGEKANELQAKNGSVERADEAKGSGSATGSGYRPQDSDPTNNGTLNAKIRTIAEGDQGSQSRESLLVQGVKKALKESVEFGDGQIKEKIQNTSQIACIVVESTRFSGYLIAALGKNRKIDSEFMSLISLRLSRFLKQQGEEVKEEEGLNINIQEVDFEGWSTEYAEFLRKSVHKGDEVALAFFPFAKVNSELGASAVAEMGTVGLEELQGDILTEFNLYIYLPTNNRYVLYTPRGSIFYGTQKEKLSERGVTHLHMRRSEAQELSKYRAQNYLNSKVNDYVQKKKGLKNSA